MQKKSPPWRSAALAVCAVIGLGACATIPEGVKAQVECDGQDAIGKGSYQYKASDAAPLQDINFTARFSYIGIGSTRVRAFDSTGKLIADTYSPGSSPMPMQTGYIANNQGGLTGHSQIRAFHMVTDSGADKLEQTIRALRAQGSTLCYTKRPGSANGTLDVLLGTTPADPRVGQRKYHTLTPPRL